MAGVRLTSPLLTHKTKLIGALDGPSRITRLPWPDYTLADYGSSETGSSFPASSRERDLSAQFKQEAILLCFLKTFPILQKPLKADVCQGMVHELFEDIERNRGDVGADEGRVEDMDRVSDTCHDDFCF